MVSRLLRRVKQRIAQGKHQADIKAYLKGGRKPWSRGYKASKFDFIQIVLKDDGLIAKFRSLDTLPGNYGYGYDERVVEYPWVLSRLSGKESKLLDAGSVLNFPQIINNSILSKKAITIFTLAPEGHAFWEKGISYCYGDLRQLPFRDNWFDEIISISTLEHVGMDNRIYTGKNTPVKVGLDAKKAARELVRVLKLGGKLLISVGFGKHQLIEWNDTVFAEQFDSPTLKDLLKEFESCAVASTSFYKYTQNGWNISTEQECQGVEYFNIHTTASFDPDNAAAARAVALVEVVK
ncbi:MAG: methyltransferase domain-containing protein [Sedimentisphaerales bacterium]